MNNIKTLYIAYDPMCSWCYGFAKNKQELIDALKDEMDIKLILGGLAPDNDEPMKDEMRAGLQNTWQRISSSLEIKFNHSYWDKNTPYRSTYPACRAIIVARKKGKELLMNKAIQKAYYLDAINPSLVKNLADILISIGINEDKNKLMDEINNNQTRQELLDEISFARSLRLDSFPSLAINKNDKIYHIELDYLNTQTMIDKIKSI